MIDLVNSITSTVPGKIAATFAVSMLPVVEVRGGIPFGASLGLDVFSTAAAAILGNLLPVPFIILFIRRIFKWLKKYDWARPTVIKLETKAYAKSANFKKYEWLEVCLFVAIPLPGTGAWTGALIAALLNMNFVRALSAISIGVAIASFIVSNVTYGLIALIF